MVEFIEDVTQREIKSAFVEGPFYSAKDALRLNDYPVIAFKCKIKTPRRRKELLLEV